MLQNVKFRYLYTSKYCRSNDTNARYRAQWMIKRNNDGQKSRHKKSSADHFPPFVDPSISQRFPLATPRLAILRDVVTRCQMAARGL